MFKIDFYSLRSQHLEFLQHLTIKTLTWNSENTHKLNIEIHVIQLVWHPTQGRRGGKKKSAGSTVTSRCSLDWSREREHVVEVLSQLAELELAQLWEPPTLQMMEDLSK